MLSSGISGNGVGKKEEERNEKVVRGLLKLPPNRRCINCNSPRPQYVCTSFWTFVCISCSGIHREFTHRVKSVSMSKFTTLEVEALQQGGNQRARELFLKDWDPEQMRYPSSSNIDSLREFIRDVYISKKYYGGKFLEKPPRDALHKSHEEYKRGSSYHSFSQSPPYDYQYEERLSGKRNGILSRKPGSDRGYHEGNISSSVSSPGCQFGDMQDDRLACGSYGSRKSDYSVSSMSDLRTIGSPSPNSVELGYNSPSPQCAPEALNREVKSQVFDAYFEANGKEVPCAQPPRTASSSSIGSFESQSLKSASSSSLADLFNDSERSVVTKPYQTSACQGSNMDSTSVNFLKQCFPGTEILRQQQSNLKSPAVDLFATLETSTNSNSELISNSTSSFENFGWATFDAPSNKPPSEKSEVGPLKSRDDELHENKLLPLLVEDNSTGLTSAGNSVSLVDHQMLREKVEQPTAMAAEPWNAFEESFVSAPDAWPVKASMTNFASQETQGLDCESTQLWQSFDAISWSAPTNPGEVLLQTNKEQTVFVQQAMSNPFDDFFEDGPHKGHKPTNPFDLPFDSEEGVSTNAPLSFMDVSSLHEALPMSDMPVALIGTLPYAWFTQSDTTSVSNGALPFLSEQYSTSQLSSRTPLSINPFA